MTPALCHVIPRDMVLQIAILFLLVSCVLQGIVVGSYNKERGVGKINTLDETVNNDIFVYIATYPAIHMGNKTILCSYSSDEDLISVSCAKFVEGFHAVSGLFLCSFIVSIIVLFFTLFAIVPLSKTTTLLIGTELIFLIIPTALHSAAIGMFFSPCLRHAKEIARRTIFAGTPVKFHRGYLSKIAIASEVFLIAALFISLGRFFLAAVYRQSVKQRDINRRDLGNFMRRHLVNDDWERQKKVLQTHARSVQLEIVIGEGNTIAKGTVSNSGGSQLIKGNNNNNNNNSNSNSGFANSSPVQEVEAEFTFRPSRVHSMAFTDNGKVNVGSPKETEPYFTARNTGEHV